MPIYEYQPSGPENCEFCSAGFEVLKKINEPVLTACPNCGAAVIRKISAPNLTKPGPSLDAANIEKHGFTQYRKSGGGTYEKTAGKGPDVINRDALKDD